ncbi:MAG TPA: CHAT domain-containing protein [Solirubrobacteraceae bacterium]|jgi:hypothetical protein
MSSMQFLDAGRVGVVYGGAPELQQLVRGQALELTKVDAIAIREPSLPSSPWFVIVDEEDREELARRLMGAAEVDPGWLAQAFGVEPAQIVTSKDEAAKPGAIVLTPDGVEGVWVPDERSIVTKLTDAILSIGRGGGIFSTYGGGGGGGVGGPAPDAAPDEMREMSDFDVGAPAPQAEPPPDAGDAAEPPGDEPEQPADAVIRRTPHVEITPGRLETTDGHTFAVEVWTDVAPPGEFEETEDVVVDAPADVKRIELGVLLKVSQHFRVADPYFQTLTVDRDVEDSERRRFEVEVVDVEAEGPAEVVAQFMYEGRPCGRVRRTWTWPDGEPVAAGEHLESLAAPYGIGPLDMSVVVTKVGAEYTCSFHAPDIGVAEWSREEVWTVREEASTLVPRLLMAFVDRTKSEAERRTNLKIAGLECWRAAPENFQTAVWKLIDERARQGKTGRPRLYITSDEPLLPWEIMLPSRERPEGGDEDRPLPLGVEFAVGRWVRGNAKTPPKVNPVRDSLLIAAQYEGDRALDPAMELAVLEEHFNGRRAEEATIAYLDEYLAEHSPSLIHLVCHGSADSSPPSIYLDGDTPLTADQLRFSPGFKAACAPGAIVFLNACDAGQAKVALGPGGVGFPRRLSELGARAIIAPVWMVTKLNAPTVAAEIYEAAAREPTRPLSDIVAELRARSYATDQPFDDSWAAYAVFGDPQATLTRA